MGRPRKPTRIMELTGAFRKDPQRRAARAKEPMLPGGIGEPPEWLDAVAREEWWRVVPDLDHAGVTSRVEAAVLGAYCAAVSRMRAAEADIARRGVVIATKAGRKKNPAVSVVEAAVTVMRQIAVEFGMTPSARSRIAAKTLPKEDVSEFSV